MRTAGIMRGSLKTIALILAGVLAAQPLASVLGADRTVLGYVNDIGVITYVSLSVTSVALIVVDLVRRGRGGDGYAWGLFTFAVSILAVPLYLVWTHSQDVGAR